MSRFLEGEEEKNLKIELDSLYENATSTHNDGLDILMVPYLKRINSIEGVATEQSCQGHSKSTSKKWSNSD